MFNSRFVSHCFSFSFEFLPFSHKKGLSLHFIPYFTIFHHFQKSIQFSQNKIFPRCFQDYQNLIDLLDSNQIGSTTTTTTTTTKRPYTSSTIRYTPFRPIIFDTSTTEQTIRVPIPSWRPRGCYQIYF